MNDIVKFDTAINK